MEEVNEIKPQRNAVVFDHAGGMDMAANIGKIDFLVVMHLRVSLVNEIATYGKT